MRFWWTCLRRRRPGAFNTRSFLYGIVISSLPFMGYFLLGPYSTSSSVPANLFTTKQSRLVLVESVSKELTSLPTCPYNPSFLIRGTIARYSGWWRINESLVLPRDDTDMLSRGSPWHWFQPSPLADRKKVSVVVNKLLTYFKSRKYYVKKVNKVIQKSDPGNGDRFLLDLELGLVHDQLNRSIRFAQHVYQRNGSDILCYPEGMNWNSSATVYFIVAVKDQGLWVHHFLKQLTIASLLTGDTNFHVVIADFQSKDINMSEAFSTSLLRSRHTIINLMGKFYKTLALNKAAEAVPNAYDILFVFDLHIDVPADIMDSVRKNTIAGRMVYFPAVGRLDQGSNSVEHRGFWQMDGYGLVAMYKSDWIRIGGMNTKDYKYKWGGEDWDLLDRVLMASLEVERNKYPGLYHHYHPHKKWN